MELNFGVVIKGNIIHMQPEQITQARIVERVCNRNNVQTTTPFVFPQKHLFHQCVVLGDCDFSDSTQLKDNWISPAIVFGVYNIENTSISNLQNAPRFAMKGANIKGTPLAKALGTDFLSGAAYHKLWLIDNNHEMISELKEELTQPNLNKINYSFNQVNIYSQAMVTDYKTVRLEKGRGKNIVILGNCDLSACKNLVSLQDSPIYIGGNLNISGTKIYNLLYAPEPRAMKGDVICKDTPLAQRTGLDIITPEIYQKIWEGDNGKGKQVYPYHWKSGVIVRAEGRFY